MSQTKTELLQGDLYINGEWVSEEEQTYFKSINPATQELVGMCAAATASQVDAAVNAASKAYSHWKNTSIPERAAFLTKAALLLKTEKKS